MTRRGEDEATKGRGDVTTTGCEKEVMPGRGERGRGDVTTTGCEKEDMPGRGERGRSDGMTK